MFISFLLSQRHRQEYPTFMYVTHKSACVYRCPLPTATQYCKRFYFFKRAENINNLQLQQNPKVPALLY